MLSDLSSLAPVLIGLAVAGFFIVRQFSARRILSVGTMLLPLGLAGFGAANLGQLDAMGLVSLAINTSLAMALGVMRGMTFRIWSDEDGEA
ncbi:MAG TPA: hypothetical protein VKV73_30845, partial [Chloroflexota bacterium]|nr:hypothetical protein [Chloroflexota bacterium]